MKNISFVFLALVLGFFIGRQNSAPTSVAEIAESSLESEFAKLELRARKDLVNSSSTEQKLKEIQKLREETFQLFLANIALKIDKNFWSSVDLTVPPKETVETIATPEPIAAAKPLVVENVAAEVKSESPPVATNTTESEERFIANNNRSGVLKDPNAYYSSSKIITRANSRLMQRIQGFYKGEARMIEPRNKTWKISINSALSSQDNIWSGNVGIEIADENNVVFSNSNGNGSNNYFYQNPNDQGSLIVQASPDIFLYLKWQEGRQIFWGSVYKKTSKDKDWKLVGRIPHLAKEP